MNYFMFMLLPLLKRFTLLKKKEKGLVFVLGWEAIISTIHNTL